MNYLQKPNAATNLNTVFGSQPDSVAYVTHVKYPLFLNRHIVFSTILFLLILIFGYAAFLFTMRHYDIDSLGTPLTVFLALVIAIIAGILIVSNIFIAQLIAPLRKTMASLENASETKSDFLARMSHEIRAPMNAIMGIAQIQQQKADLPEEFRTMFDKIHNSSTYLLGIINDILDLSRIEIGKFELHPIEYNVLSMIDDSVQSNIMRIGIKPVDFELLVDKNLPVKLFGDEARLKQILNNLLSNAFKYTERGCVSLTVSTVAEGADVILTLKAADTGRGIKNEDLPSLFSEYQRFNTGTGRKVEGAGLGLSVVKLLAAQMGGKVSVESEYGKGSAFTVTVKQGVVANSDVIGPELSKKLRDFTFSSAKRSAARQISRKLQGTALVVDDVDVNLLVAEGLLLPYGLKVEKAGSGFVAIDLIKNGRSYDIIFMDHIMPQMDGVETTRELRAMGYDGIIVALTANAIAGNEEMFIKNGFNGYISKPVDVREFDAILNKFVVVKQADSTVKPREGAPPREAAPEEAEPKHTAPERVKPAIKISERFLKALKNDVARAITTLRKTTADGEIDVKLFTTTVHGLKSAFAAIGENEKSQKALKFEMAGRNNDTELIFANVEEFINELEEYLKNG